MAFVTLSLLVEIFRTRLPRDVVCIIHKLLYIGMQPKGLRTVFRIKTPIAYDSVICNGNLIAYEARDHTLFDCSIIVAQISTGKVIYQLRLPYGSNLGHRTTWCTILWDVAGIFIFRHADMCALHVTEKKSTSIDYDEKLYTTQEIRSIPGKKYIITSDLYCFTVLIETSPCRYRVYKWNNVMDDSLPPIYVMPNVAISPYSKAKSEYPTVWNFTTDEMLRPCDWTKDRQLLINLGLPRHINDLRPEGMHRFLSYGDGIGFDKHEHYVIPAINGVLITAIDKKVYREDGISTEMQYERRLKYVGMGPYGAYILDAYHTVAVWVY